MTASVAIAALLGPRTPWPPCWRRQRDLPGRGQAEYLDAARTEESLPVELW